jgi:hypothetical protein
MVDLQLISARLRATHCVSLAPWRNKFRPTGNIVGFADLGLNEVRYFEIKPR